MNILFASGEACPFFTSGRLGDMTGNLARALERLNIEVRVILPLYGDMEAKWRERLKFLGSYPVPVSWRVQHCGLFELPLRGVRYYFLDNEYYFKRPGFYGYIDDGERFAFFSRAVLETLRHIDFIPQIIHCHDWQTALVPVYLNLNYRRADKFVHLKTIFTFQDIQYQGKFGPKIAEDVLGIGREHYPLVEYDGLVNFMKGGIEAADMVSTVSPSYAREILDPAQGHGLAPLLRQRENKLRGILNGIDPEEYNPATDKLIPLQYDIDTFGEGKAQCKESLRRLFGLERKDVPLIGVITPFTGDAGSGPLISAADEIVKAGMQLAILGGGEDACEQSFRELAARRPGQCSARFGLSPDIDRAVYAGSDMFLMPGRAEPCGFAQMAALRYGSVPIVLKTGGLGDTIVDGENGFVFSSGGETRDACLRARSLWQNRDKWAALIRRAMKCDFSWAVSAKGYAALYQETLGPSKPGTKNPGTARKP